MLQGVEVVSSIEEMEALSDAAVQELAEGLKQEEVDAAKEKKATQDAAGGAGGTDESSWAHVQQRGRGDGGGGRRSGGKRDADSDTTAGMVMALSGSDSGDSSDDDAERFDARGFVIVDPKAGRRDPQVRVHGALESEGVAWGAGASGHGVVVGITRRLHRPTQSLKSSPTAAPRWLCQRDAASSCA
jgi:hypothetical protein